jgi:hypothetical protein
MGQSKWAGILDWPLLSGTVENCKMPLTEALRLR